MTDRIHTCSYYCHHAACIKAQRDELRDKYVETKNTHRVVPVELLIRAVWMLRPGLPVEEELRAIIEEETKPDGFKSLTLEEVEDIIKSNITITDQRLYEGVYAVAVDIEIAIKNKNS